jgi:hypothetical protein
MKGSGMGVFFPFKIPSLDSCGRSSKELVHGLVIFSLMALVDTYVTDAGNDSLCGIRRCTKMYFYQTQME